MSRVAIVAVAGALSLQAVGAPVRALAADMPSTLPPAYEHPLPPPRAFDFNTGWYLRGDLGYHWGRIQAPEPAPPFPSPTDNKLNGSCIAGGSASASRPVAAHRLHHRLRLADEIRRHASLTPTTPPPRSRRPPRCSTAISISAPGTARRPISAPASAPPGCSVPITPARRRRRSAATPRTSNGISPGPRWPASPMPSRPTCMVDVGYRYLNFGDVTTAPMRSAPMTFKNIAAHEVRVGLRWSFDDLYPAR